MKRIIIMLSLALCLSGCINAVKHVPPSQTVDVYLPTRFVACDAVGVWWNDAYCARYPIESAWLKLTWLVWVVDLPCEVVMDTLWFPYDFYCMRQYEKKQVENAKKHSRFGAEVQTPAYKLNGEYKISIQ